MNHKFKILSKAFLLLFPLISLEIKAQDQGYVGASMSYAAMQGTGGDYYSDSYVGGLSYKLPMHDFSLYTEGTYIGLKSDDFLNAYKTDLVSLNMGPMVNILDFGRLRFNLAILPSINFWQTQTKNPSIQAPNKDRGSYPGLVGETNAEIKVGNQEQVALCLRLHRSSLQRNEFISIGVRFETGR